MAPFRRPTESEGRAATRLLLVAIVIYGLYAGREVLAPLALALLLTVASLPVVDWMQRVRLPRVPSVILVLLAVVGIIGGVLYLVASQAFLLLAELPRYESELRAKLLLISSGSGPIDEVMRLVNRLGQAVQTDGPAQPPVAVIQVAPSLFSELFAVLGAVLGPAAIIAITLLLMAFLLINREDVRDRALRLMGTGEIHRTTQAMQDATGRVGRYLLMQMAVNAGFGLAMGLGLWGLGVPNAPLWGVMGFALRFVPYLGAPLAAIFPILVSFAITDGWTTVILVAAWFIFVVAVVSYVLEPLLYGASAGVTPLALLLSSIFWAALWGPVGLILAPAITACLVIAGRHLPGFGLFDVLLGNGAPLSMPERFYQRLLAGDAPGAARLLAAEAEEDGEGAALRRLVQPAVERIVADRPSADYGAALALRATRALITALESLDTPLPGMVEVLVVPAGGALDRAVAAMAVAALRDAGWRAETAPRGDGVTPLAVLVLAGGLRPGRLARMMAETEKLARQVLLFAPVDEGAATLMAFDGTLRPERDLDALLAGVEGALGQELVPG